MKNIFIEIIFLIFLINCAFSSDISLNKAYNASQNEIASAVNKIDIKSFKISVNGAYLNQPIIITPENLDEWGRINLSIVPPDNYSSDYIVYLSLDSGQVWRNLPISLNYEFTPENEITNTLGVRVIAHDNIEINIFKENTITYLNQPEKHYIELVKRIFTLAFNNKDIPSFMKYISSSYIDSDDNRYTDIEDKLNLELKNNIFKFTLKNFEINRVDMSKFKVMFEWTKSSDNVDSNNVANLFGRSVFIFENDLIIQTIGDTIFTESVFKKHISRDHGVLKGGSINLLPDESFEFATDIIYKDNILRGDIAIKKDGKFLKLYVPGGMIQDMGIIQISEIEEAPETGYYENAPVIIGHSYCLRTDNNRYAKLQVTYVEGAETGQTAIVVSINWIYQENESRILKPQ